MVDLERTYYQVLEDVGEVEVCAIVYSPKIDCPIAFPFDVNVTTNDSSAGTLGQSLYHYDSVYANSYSYSLCY